MILVKTNDLSFPVKVDGAKFYVQDCDTLYVTDAEDAIVAIFKHWDYAVEEIAVAAPSPSVITVPR